MTKHSENPEMNHRINTLIMGGMSAKDATAQARIDLAKSVGARVNADRVNAGEAGEDAIVFLTRAAEQTNRALGLTEDTDEARAERERARQDRVRACIAAMGT